MTIELRLKKMEEKFTSQIDELRKLIVGRNLVGNWVKQPMACAMINVKPRQLRSIRIHVDKEGNKVGCIKWRKGKGRTVEYFKPDLEKYLNQITIG
jgi:hypothetical protein